MGWDCFARRAELSNSHLVLFTTSSLPAQNNKLSTGGPIDFVHFMKYFIGHPLVLFRLKVLLIVENDLILQFWSSAMAKTT